MSVVCPTVTAEDLHTYRLQLERVQSFAPRIHLDFMDGLFTANKSLDLKDAWMPNGIEIDLHLMYTRPDIYIDWIDKFRPSMVIVHAEAKGEYPPFAEKLLSLGVKRGVCLLQETPVSMIEDSLDKIDHVLIFSGNLGHFGGEVDLGLLKKVTRLKQLKPAIEIGWDGGINDQNVNQLADAGVDVLNVGGFIQKSDDPRAQYVKLVSLSKQ